MKHTRVKICCISSQEEARLAIEYGADALELVGPMPGGGPGIIGDKLAREIAVNVPPTVETFLLTSQEQGNEIADHVEFCGTTSVQIVRHTVWICVPESGRMKYLMWKSWVSL